MGVQVPLRAPIKSIIYEFTFFANPLDCDQTVTKLEVNSGATCERKSKTSASSSSNLSNIRTRRSYASSLIEVTGKIAQYEATSSGNQRQKKLLPHRNVGVARGLRRKQSSGCIRNCEAGFACQLRTRDLCRNRTMKNGNLLILNSIDS